MAADPEFQARVDAKAQEIFDAIRESEADAGNPAADEWDISNIVAVLAAKLAVAQVQLDELHDRILELEGRGNEKPDRTP